MCCLKKHEEYCLILLGNPYTEIHQFLNEKLDPYELVNRHWRHHWEGIITACDKFGLEAFWPAVIHIRADCMGYIPTATEYKTRRVNELGFPIILINDIRKIDIARTTPNWYVSIQNRPRSV